ncbi:MAG: M48 family metalloprotease [Candidatus Omnitrophica bacterium]|nr:M48 family metalloprotease [Candidatus Omnitrophota bacterium]
MPFTFVEIEEHKTRKLVLLFAVLVLLYIVSIIALVWGSRLILGIERQPSLGEAFSLVCIAVIIAALHWAVSTYRLVDRVLTAILAKPLDPTDTYHQRLKNIIEEVSVATGGRYQIEPYVMPTVAMNACAVADFSGRAAIAVTEGCLARLNRAQLEGVIGHEAAHIASGDSLSRSVFCGLFELHEEALKRLTGVFSDSAGRRVTIRGRGGALILFVMAVLWVTNTAKRLAELCVSREQEYRADATAVRLTRNPLGLAEALRLIETHWRGIGTDGDSLSTIFILDPGAQYLSEQDGFFADWFSTHPPTHRRIDALLGMAHLSIANFNEMMALHHGKRARQLPPDKPGEVPSRRWSVWLDGTWRGPLTLEQLAGLESLTPESWLRPDGEQAVKPASHEPSVLAVLQRRYGHAGQAPQPGKTECPNCRLQLTQVLYEGVPLDACPACRGCYVMPDQVSRILAREEYAFSDRIKRLAATMPTLSVAGRITKRFNAWPGNRMQHRQCPKCGSGVVRKFFTNQYLIEVEQCWVCGLAWFDKDELELLQYLYEEAKAKGQSTFLEPA